MSLYSWMHEEQYESKQQAPHYSGLGLLVEEVLLKERWD